MPTAILETERLRLRPRRMSDLTANLAMDLDPKVNRYLFPHGVPSRAERRRELTARYRSDWPRIGGLWIVEWREHPGFLGWSGVFPLEDSGLIELGYRYCHRAWGQGVATEAGRRILEHAFSTLGIDPIVAVRHPNNVASRRVLQKLGFKEQGVQFHYGLDLPFHILTRHDFETAPSSLK